MQVEGEGVSAINLLKETEEELLKAKKSWDDVRFVQTEKGSFSIDKFKQIADIIYDDGYGGVNVNEDLVIVGDDWWLERGEYDGSEWWEFKTIPKQKEPTENVQIFSKWASEFLDV